MFISVYRLNSSKHQCKNCKMTEKKKKHGKSEKSFNNLIHDMELEVLKQKVSKKHKQMVQEIDIKLDKVFDDFLDEVTKMSLNHFEIEKLFNDNPRNSGKGDDDKTKLHKGQNGTFNGNYVPRLKLPEKNFKPQNSLLTELFEIKHIKTIYHIFIVIFNLLLLNVFISDFADTGSLNIGDIFIRLAHYSHSTYPFMIIFRTSSNTQRI